MDMPDLTRAAQRELCRLARHEGDITEFVEERKRKSPSRAAVYAELIRAGVLDEWAMPHMGVEATYTLHENAPDWSRKISDRLREKRRERAFKVFTVVLSGVISYFVSKCVAAEQVNSMMSESQIAYPAYNGIVQPQTAHPESDSAG